MRYLSLFSGIEAATVAWHPLGWKPVAFAEIDARASEVLAHHYPDIPNLGDVITLRNALRVSPHSLSRASHRKGLSVKARLWLRTVADLLEHPPDVLVGGSPCQAFSVAGMRRSLSDARGNLTIVYTEIVDAIKPRFVVWENVPGVLSTKDNAFGSFLGALAGEDCALQPPGGKWQDAGCVFGPERTIAWRVLDAQYFGLAQRRRRVFAVASPADGADPSQILHEFDGVRRDSPPSREAGQEVASTLTSGAANGSAAHGARSGHAKESNLIPSLASAQDTLAFGGNNTRSHLEVATACRAKGGSGHGDFESETFVVQAQSVALRGRDGGNMAELGNEVSYGLRCGSGGSNKPHVLYALQDVRERDKAQNGAGWSDAAATQGVCVTGDVTHALRADGFDASEDGTGRGTPIVAVHEASEELRPRTPISFYPTNRHPDRGNFEDLSPTIKVGSGKGSGEPPAVAFTCKNDGQDAGEVAPTMRSMAHHRSHPNGGGQLAIAVRQPDDLAPVMRVRRLTPAECEKLQGFLVGYTHIPRRKLTAQRVEALRRAGKLDDAIAQGDILLASDGSFHAAMKDGPRYKMLGNSMATYVMRWIGRRIERRAQGHHA